MLNVNQLRKLPAYKKLPPLYKKSSANRETLVKLIKIIEEADEQDKQYPNREKDLRRVLHDIELMEKYQCNDPYFTSTSQYQDLQLYGAAHYFFVNEFRDEDGCVQTTMDFIFDDWDLNNKSGLNNYHGFPLSAQAIASKYEEAKKDVKLEETKTFYTHEICKRSFSRMKVVLVNIVNRTTNEGHALVVIVDKKTRECEIFDPQGALGNLVYLQDKIIPKLKEYLKLEKYNIITSGEFCPVGPQVVLNAPICALFSYFYVWLRIRHPDVPRKDVLDLYVNRTKSNLKIIMNNWQCYMIQSVRNNGGWEILLDIYMIKKTQLGDIENVKKRQEIANRLYHVYDKLFETGNVENAKHSMADIVDDIEDDL
jgi:hypothetical protein